MRNFLLHGLFIGLLLITTGCQTQTSVSVTTVNGECANGLTNAPYCMSVTIQNNSGGQNFINSTSLPLTGISIAITGVSNVLSPAATSSMDPNGCTNSSIAPGSSCTFYLQLNQEFYSVGSVTPFIVTINYTVNDGLSSIVGGSGGAQSSYSFTLNQYTNLYAITSSGINNLTLYNNSGLTYYTLESTAGSAIQTSAIDNSSYGYLWFGTNQGMYWFGNGNTSGNNTYNPSGLTSASVSSIFTSQPSPFESQTSTPANMYGVISGGLYSFTFSTITWGSLIAQAPTNLLSNVNAVSSSGSNILLASSGQVYACSTASSGASCNNEAVALNSIADIGFTVATSVGYTGLYAATANGLYVESGTFPSSTNIWTQVTGDGIESAQISVITTDDSGNIYVGDNSGDVWLVSAVSSPTTAAHHWSRPSNQPITSMVFDNIGNSLYLTSGTNLYQCNLLDSSCQSVGLLGNANQPAGLLIGSSISN